MGSSEGGSVAKSHWRANLVRNLDLEARILGFVMRGDRDEIYGDTVGTLKKSGVI
jgi:hypothetical protein